MPSTKPDKICIIGAGAAGIAAANALSRVSVQFDWFEAGSQLGGLWRYGNDTGSSIYASLVTNTSQRNMQWFDYPMPAEKNRYLSHRQVLDYLTSFTAHANLQTRVTLSTRVTGVEPLAHGRFRVSAQSRANEQCEREYSAVVVASGRHSTPKWPKIPGTLDTFLMHAADYRTPDVFTGKRAVVVGFGASGADIAADAASVATSVVLSTESGGYLLPRYAGGKPRDEKSRSWSFLIPLAIRKQLWRVLLKRRPISSKVRLALEQNARLFAKPGVINDHLAELIDGDKVIVKGRIKRLEGDSVRFTDDSSVPCDVLVCATGYETTYPFFSSELLEQNARFSHRYLRVLPPQQPGLYFIGHLSVVGPFFPVLERQALWVADLLSDRCTLPPVARMQHLATRQAEADGRIYPDARREDTVDYHPYVRLLEKEHKAGRIRRSRIPRCPAEVPDLNARREPTGHF